MSDNLFQPLKNLDLNRNTCFLSGEEAELDSTVFPSWLITEYELEKKYFKFLDESLVCYPEIKVPVSKNTITAIDEIEYIFKIAVNEGYEGIKNLNEMLIFNWVGKIAYGLIYNELSIAIKQYQNNIKDFNISQGLLHKFSNLQLMLQAITRKIIFEDFLPFSIYIFKLDNKDTPFVFRDDINSLTASVKMRDFGIIINLQDNGLNKQYHSDFLNSIQGRTLSNQQFEEVCAKIYYSAYLFNRLPEYHIFNNNEQINIEAINLRGMSSKPLFDDWQNKVYAQVLENFWKPYNISQFEILKNPQLLKTSF